MAGLLEWGGAAGPALKTANDTMGNMVALKQQAEHQRALESNQAGFLKISQDKSVREQKSFDYEQQKRDSEEKARKTLRPVTEMAPNLDKNPTLKQYWVDAVKKAGFDYVEENGVSLASGEAIDFVTKAMTKDTEFMKGTMEATKVDSANRYQAALKAKTEAEAKGKEVKPEIMQAFNQATSEYAGIVNGQKQLEKYVSSQNIGNAIKSLQEQGSWDKMPDAVKTTFMTMQKTGDEIGFKEVMGRWAAAELKTPSDVPHTIEKTSPDGKNAQKFQYNPNSKAVDKYDIPIGNPYPVKSQVININQQNKENEGFKTWTPEAKNQTFMYNAITGKPPVNAQGMGSNDRQAYGKQYAQWQVEKGIRPQDLSLMQADYRAGNMSLNNMTKQEAPMSAFVLNINKQIAKVQELYTNEDRIGVRLLDLPIRELKVKAKGSGLEASRASYLLEISNEIGKLSSGASASVQQLSDSAKEDWKKVHDVNLSLKEINIVLNSTRDQANMRMSTWREAKQEVRNQLKAIGVPDNGGSEVSGLKVGDVKKGYRFLGGNPADKNSWEKQ